MPDVGFKIQGLGLAQIEGSWTRRREVRDLGGGLCGLGGSDELWSAVSVLESMDEG
jgi:hypothetical protein